ncbi:MAG: hypothetical protein PHE58_02100 [Candidatus Omnitrophica bacterium]|nr:hypothetical protein [Candidatus Omnitrophota bacterium]
MKKILFLIFALCFVSSFAIAQETAGTMAASDTVTITGVIIDNACATANKDTLEDFVKTHLKSCALMPNCVASGYSIFADGQLSKFDKESNVKIAEFLKKEDSKLQVVVTAKKAGEELSLVSIENQK